MFLRSLRMMLRSYQSLKLHLIEEHNARTVRCAMYTLSNFPAVLIIGEYAAD